MSDNSIKGPATELRSTVVVIQHASEPRPASNGGVGVARRHCDDQLIPDTLVVPFADTGLRADRILGEPHSVRMASSGLTEAALRAGRYAATKPTANSSPAMPANVGTSIGLVS